MPPDATIYEGLTDFELIERIIAGESSALEWLMVHLCGPMFVSLCASYPDAALEPGDVVGEVYTSLFKNDWKALRDFRGKNAQGKSCKLKTYVITNTARLIKKLSQRNSSEICWSAALSDEDGNWLEVEDRKAELDRDKASVVEAVMTAIAALDKPQERLVLLEFAIAKRPVEQVAQMLEAQTGVKGSAENVYTICKRAKRNLRALLERGGMYA